MGTILTSTTKKHPEKPKGHHRKEIYYEKILVELQNIIVEACEGVPSYPKRLSLEEQGIFNLGYYFQTQKRFEKKAKEED